MNADMQQIVCQYCSSASFGVFTPDDEDYYVVCETCGSECKHLLEH